MAIGKENTVYIYADSQEFQDFITKMRAMDRETLVNELEFLQKSIFFTDRAAGRETPGGDQTMHHQLARLNTQKFHMEKELESRPKPKKVKKRAKKRR
jgi:hypothetical protein